jgi:hypothetical protein
LIRGVELRMPYIGLSLHILVAIYFAVHALKTGRQMYWLFILFSFPLLGLIAYFFVEYLPDMQRDIDVTVKTWSSRTRKLHKRGFNRLAEAWSRAGQRAS